VTEGSGQVTAAGQDQRSSVAVPDDSRRPSAARWTVIGVAVVLAAFVMVLATREPASTKEADSPLLGQPAPEVAGDSYSGEPFRLSSLRGRYVVVNFFATWCIPCREEHPQLVLFQSRHQAAGDATVVSIVYDDTPAKVREFFADNGGDWPVVDDAGAKVDYGVRGVPESFVIDPDGFVVARVVGGVRADSLDAIISRTQG
jgi:cytochrome c biogenesis protein CcmG, thiol:disulfide interchange protein DsbE